ncbi:MAG: deoxyribodipyrimidine photolyase [Deltaproteobacteria bacterium]|jgi:deoxyribodipyrimidine photo-lyase|nr:deoxyribodipyrimidine photolyase [Deltaproteobacteria bacterium]MBT6490512.1 deoxyribodipyrimidine photolyase [Deltaproteobacteria bacterium]
MSTQLVWFKRDLRVEDHQPLYEAANRGSVICLYIDEPIIQEAAEFGERDGIFLEQCLSELDTRLRDMGAGLLRVKGDALQVLEELHAEIPFEAIWSHEETGNNATYERDQKIASWARNSGVDWNEIAQHGIFRPLKKRDGWAGKWARRMKSPLSQTPDQLYPALIPPRWRKEPVKKALDLQVQLGGAREAHKVFNSFLDSRGENYRTDMSSPVTAWSGCSRLSPYLAYGCISIKTVYQTTVARREQLKQWRAAGDDIGKTWLTSLASFEKRLRWHCHFMQKFEDETEIEHRNLARVYDGMRSEEPNEERFEAWKAGRTGYPMVDACMRALVATGWINFRMRAMLVSFASYHLWLHWRPTGLFLGRQFLDFEPGIHYSQMQMQSGTTGINAVRIYSPTKQVRDQDPNGEFIKHWVPELSDVPRKYLAEPAQMPAQVQTDASCEMGIDYPEPLVQHASAVKTAKERIYACRKTPEAKEQAKQIYLKHGSRRRPRNPRQRSRATKSGTEKSIPVKEQVELFSNN